MHVLCVFLITTEGRLKWMRIYLDPRRSGRGDLRKELKFTSQTIKLLQSENLFYGYLFVVVLFFIVNATSD